MATLTINKHRMLMLIAAIALLVAGFFAGYEYRTNEFRKAVSEAFSDTSEKSPANNPATDDGKEGLKSTYHKIGEEITFTTQTMKVNSARSDTTLTAQYSSPWVADKDTKFIVVDHTVTNTGSSPFMFEEFELFDSKGRRFTASGEVFGKVDNYLAVRQLSPGVPETGVSVYVVPSNVTNFEFGGKNATTGNLELVKFSVD